MKEKIKNLLENNLINRKANAHKGSYNKVLIIGGSKEYQGAPLIVAHAALRSGVGQVRMLIHQDNIINFVYPEVTYMEYNEETDTYYAIGSGLDNQEDVFLLDKIQKQDNGYTVQIVEYLEDYSEGYETSEEDYNVQIKNLKDETIGEVKSTESETNIQQFVKDNIDKFTKKEVNLKTDENGNIYVTSVRNI